MKFKYISTVFKKEIKDMLRDRRTIISSIVIPMILIPVLYFILGNSMDSIEKDVKENLSIGIVNYTEDKKEFLKTELLKDNIEDVNITISDSKEATEDLKKGNIRIVIELEEEYENKKNAKEPINIKTYYDSSKMTSSSSVSAITQALNMYNVKMSASMLAELGINPEILAPVKFSTNDVAPEESKDNSSLSMILPMIISMLLATAGAPAAIDLLVGERERKTFEPLLSTKADRSSILIGKYFAISVFSAFSLISSLIGVVIGMKLSPAMFGSAGFAFSGSSIMIILIILAIILFGFMCSAIQMILSAFAKTIKEGNTYVSFLTFAIMIPAYATMFMQAGDIQSYMAFVPALNIIALLKMVLSNMIDLNYTIFTILSTLIYLSVLIVITFKLFKKENMVIR